jgi:DNA-binding PadR family transcriptional regulator
MPASDLLPLNPRDHLILFSLATEERHGYGIVKDVEQTSRSQVRLDPANLYRSIKRMLVSGLVEEAGARVAVDAEGERRRYYRITALGLEVVRLESARLADLTDQARTRKLIPGRGRS